MGLKHHCGRAGWMPKTIAPTSSRAREHRQRKPGDYGYAPASVRRHQHHGPYQAADGDCAGQAHDDGFRRELIADISRARLCAGRPGACARRPIPTSRSRCPICRRPVKSPYRRDPPLGRWRRRRHIRSCDQRTGFGDCQTCRTIVGRINSARRRRRGIAVADVTGDLQLNSRKPHPRATGR